MSKSVAKQTLFINGQLYINGKWRRKNFLTAHGRIMGIYDREIVRKGRAAHIVDLQNMIVLPGFTDCHIHLLDYAIATGRIDLSKANSEQQVIDILLKKANRGYQTRWLLGRGWSYNNWKLPVLPTKKSLDKYFPDKPVVLSSKCGHLLWVNSVALKICGISRYTPDPAGGRIDRESQSGQPTGILREAAIEMALEKIDRPSRQLQKQLLKKTIRHLNRCGLCALHIHEDTECFSLLQELCKENNLSLRCFFFLPGDTLEELVKLKLHSGFGNQWLRLAGIKIFADGSLGGRTAFMKKPYQGERSYRGICVKAPKELKERIYRANQAGLAVAVHAIGDAAVGYVLAALEALRDLRVQGFKSTVKNRIEHFQIFDPGDLKSMAMRDVVASVQPIHIFQDWQIADRLWGQRSRFAYAFQTIRRSGALLCFGSDAPVESPDPFLGIYAAMFRQDLEAQPSTGWYPEEKLSFAEAVKAYTINPARAEGMERDRGTITEGKFCDFIALPEKSVHYSLADLKKVKVALTVVGGKIVHKSF